MLASNDPLELADELIRAIDRYFEVYYSQAELEPRYVTDWAQAVIDEEMHVKDCQRAYLEARKQA